MRDIIQSRYIIAAGAVVAGLLGFLAVVLASNHFAA